MAATERQLALLRRRSQPCGHPPPTRAARLNASNAGARLVERARGLAPPHETAPPSDAARREGPSS